MFGGPGRVGRQNDDALVAFLEANRGSAEYLVAATGSMSAAPLMLATRAPVISIGGFNGGDPAPTAAQLEDLIASGALRFVLLGGRMGGPGPGGGFGQNTARTAWVEAFCTPVDPSAYGGPDPSEERIGPVGERLYDCASAAQPASNGAAG